MDRITTIREPDALFGAIAPVAGRGEGFHPSGRSIVHRGGALRGFGDGESAGFVHIENEKTLVLPERHGSNRIGSLRVILADPRIARLFLVPGIGETLPVNGRAEIRAGASLPDRFAA